MCCDILEFWSPERIKCKYAFWIPGSRRASYWFDVFIIIIIFLQTIFVVFIIIIIIRFGYPAWPSYLYAYHYHSAYAHDITLDHDNIEGQTT